jgi:DNA-binding Lrp family transcriptional regulator
MSSLDEKDVRILHAIGQERTTQSERLGEATAIPPQTVYYRRRKLREEGVLQGDLADVDLESVGLPVTVISDVDAEFDRGYHEEVGQKLADIDGVNQVYFTMGDTDFVVVSHLVSHDNVVDLVEAFESIPEITRTNSTLAVSTIKAGDSPLVDYDVDTLVDELTD